MGILPQWMSDELQHDILGLKLEQLKVAHRHLKNQPIKEVGMQLSKSIRSNKRLMAGVIPELEKVRRYDYYLMCPDDKEYMDRVKYHIQGLFQELCYLFGEPHLQLTVLENNPQEPNILQLAVAAK